MFPKHLGAMWTNLYIFEYLYKFTTKSPEIVSICNVPLKPIINSNHLYVLYVRLFFSTTEKLQKPAEEKWQWSATWGKLW